MGLIKFVVEGSTYPSFSMIYHNEMNFTKIFAGSLARIIKKYKNLKHKII
jgi:hypothetical protein